ncbi:MAG: esterase-like activity of phytase family protein [Sphingomonas bacterium]|nr:esterase-like activity of phytase family protein [Sphingomonas bacterium]
MIGARWLLTNLPDREQRPDARATVRFDPIMLDPHGVAPLRIAGAWRLTSDDSRLGGVSALAIDRGEFIALTDSGVVIRLPKPRPGVQLAHFRDLPTGPGSARYKAGRDSEALALDSGGRGWWVAFENRHAAYLFDREFIQVERRIGLGELGWRANKGAEGALLGRHSLLLFPESGDEIVEVGKAGIKRIPLNNPFGRLADVTELPDGRVVVLARSFGPRGFSSRLLLLGEELEMKPFARLNLGRLDNPEAIAAESLPGGAVRLWVMTDNDFRRRVPTLLLALDWAG